VALRRGFRQHRGLRPARAHPRYPPDRPVRRRRRQGEPLLMSAHTQEVIVLLALNVIAAYGAFLPLAAGQLNLGIAGFMAIGGYVSAYLSNSYSLPALLTVFIGALCAGVVALIVAAPVLRTRGIYLALMTFGLGELVQATILN